MHFSRENETKIVKITHSARLEQPALAQVASFLAVYNFLLLLGQGGGAERGATKHSIIYNV